MKRLTHGLGLAAVLAATITSCVTPSIPIPPPDPAKMTFSVDATANVARFTYPANENYVGSVVFVYNRTLGVGIIEDAHPDGSVGPTQPVSASLGNQVVVTFQNGEQSVSTCIKLRDGAQSPYDYCE